MSIPGLLSSEPFIPHTLAHLTEARVFPSPLPEAFYDGLLKDYQALAEASVHRIAYESGGLKVTGLMALPAGISSGRHPLLIYNRGGSREYGKLTLVSVMRSMVPFAKRGYLVFASNYRGNDGGEGREEFGGGDVDDVLNLLELARKHPGYDGGNAYMLGHSRGAMMTYLAIKQGAKLNAAITIAGVSDIRAATDKDSFTRLIPGTDRAKAYSDRSAAAWPEKLKTPVLLLHGDADETIPIRQSIAMAEALKRMGTPCELVMYPGGNHALVRYWDDVVRRSLDWMEAYRQ